MRNASQIITRNVLREIERVDKEVAEDGEEFDLNLLAARMCEYTGWKLDSVKTQLKRFVDDQSSSTWRIDYVEAIARSFGRDVAWFVKPHDPKELKEATPSQVLISALSARLDREEIRRLARIFNQLLDHRPFYDLTLKFADILINSGKSKAETALSAVDIVNDSAAWDVKRRNLRAKKRRDKKS